MKCRPIDRRMRTGPVRAASPRFLPIVLLSLLVAAGLAGRAAAETRIALVIGISAYQNAPPLANPVNDARAIGDALRRLNFEVEELRDPDFRALTRGLREFGIHAQGAETAVVYYAGHGVQLDRENYLMPADAKLERAHDLEYEALPLSLMLSEVSQASKIGIILLDSCRNNPFVERVDRSLNVAGRVVEATPGMARVDSVPRNTMVVMAAKAGQIAEDGKEHSPFAAAILAHLQLPGLELSLFFRSVRDTVLKATQNRQEPYVFSSLGAEPFYFYPRPPNRPPEIGQIRPLEVLDTAGPTPLGIPRPTDPDQDPLTVRIIGLPRSGEIRVEARPATSGEAFGLDHFMATATFKPDGKMVGPIGTLDILVEDGRGGSAMGSLPIVVLPSNWQPSVETPATKPAPENLVSATPELTTAPQNTIPFGLAEARAAAPSLPCALIDVREAPSPHGDNRLYVSGPALPGAALDVFLQQLGGPARLARVTTERLDAGHCPALAMVTDLVRRSRERLAHFPSGASGLNADLATLSIAPSIRPAGLGPGPLPIASAPSRATSPGGVRCQGIVEHIQLGETLSDADRAIFRTRCGR
jgi:Caspase domain